MNRAMRRLWKRLLGSFFSRGRDSDLAEELESHIQLMADDQMRRGVPPAEAYRLARLKFGAIESTKESYRDQRGLPFLETLGQDLRYAFRGIRRSPGFAFVAILSLAIGIGANTAIFSVVNTVLLQPLAYREPARLFSAGELLPNVFGQNPVAINPVHAREWAKHCPSIEQVSVLGANPADLASGGVPISVPGVDVTHNLFSLLGVEPILGRTFLPAEEQEGQNRSVILAESLWRTRFRADPSLVGRSIVIDRQQYQVVGILPAWFQAPYGVTNAFGARFEVYRPLVLGKDETNRLMGNHNYTALVRLARGARQEQAVAEMDVVQARFPRAAGVQRELKAKLIPVHEFVTGRAQLSLWMLAASVGAVLLIVCINLANLLLSRIASRSREAAIRTALGASRARQFCTVVTESLLLAFLGGVLGILLAIWSVRAIRSTTTLDIPRLAEVSVDLAVLLFALVLTLLTGFVFGALPAWRLTRSDPQEALRAGSHTLTEPRGGLRLRQALIGLEVGLSTTLLIIAGLLVASLTRLLQVDKGFDSAHVLTIPVGLSGDLYREPESRGKFFDRLLAQVNTIPGVHASGVITQLPTQGRTWNDAIYLEGGPRRIVDNRYTSPGYFRAMSIPIIKGRAFDESDRGRGVAVLSEKAAKLLWPEEPNPVGLRFMGEDDKLKTLVGITAEVRAQLQSEPPPTAYYPYWQRVPGAVALAIRTTADPRTTYGSLRATLRSLDPELPIREIQTMEEIIDGAVAQRRFQASLVIAFAASALVVASLGIFGVVSYSVARRRNEIGIRMALGAQRSQLLRLVLRQGMTPVVFGLAAGLAGAYLLGRAIRGLLFEVQPGDPLTITGVIALLLVVGLLACLVPARRAAGTDVLAAIRFE